MKARVITNLNIRARAPRILPDNNPGYLLKNTTVEIEAVVVGDDYKGNNIWYRLVDGTYIWSGGIAERIHKVGGAVPGSLARETDYNLDWWHNAFGIRDLWERYGTRGAGAEVAILDSGIAQPLAGKWYTPCFEYNNITGINSDGSADYADETGHGTQVAGIIAARGDILGVAPECKIFACKYFSQEPAVDRLINGLQQIPPHISIVVITSGFLPDKVTARQRTQLHDAVKTLADRALIFCSVGDDCNHDDNPFDRLPAAFPGLTLGVASVNAQRLVSDFSTRATCITLAAPGEYMRVVDIKRDGIYTADGTSFAAPFAAGVCALARAVEPTLALHDIRNALIDTVDPAGEPELYGRGIINPVRMFEKLKL